MMQLWIEYLYFLTLAKGAHGALGFVVVSVPFIVSAILLLLAIHWCDRLVDAVCHRLGRRG
ncbi:hypothetical protein [Microvirga arsenatis]|uniref:Uncharacterized protein n=1 Tax=Microvirga arsenatis TaxID=2692265 RepID=A0ABW9YZ88_9HYPH|nr:hypothetical protein [Microvirga arsenatis]NBJ13220.1 hypothetical protein [Microvirga arsenatis]NBJ25142.1 hypothetical protein [Microvirga arsenatis]